MKTRRGMKWRVGTKLVKRERVVKQLKTVIKCKNQIN